MTPSPRSSLRNRSIARRRVAYTLAAGAAVNMAADADAVVVYSGIEDISIEPRGLLELRMNADAYPDIYLRNYVDPIANIVGNYQGAFINWGPGRLVAKQVGNLFYVRALEAGFEVNSNTVHPTIFYGSMAFGEHNPNAEFNDVENVFIGFRFANFPTFPLPIPERPVHYGWVRVSIDNANRQFLVHDWAYESEPDVGIVTGFKGEAGDFNADGTVDTADYTVWRDNLGTKHPLGDRGDENGDSAGVVDEDDYTIWKANFGASFVVPEISAATAPEPTALGLLAAGSLGVLALRRRHRGQS